MNEKMQITYAPRDILQIDNARIVFRNFAGEESKFNRKGDRNFAVVIDDEELAEELTSKGWNVKVKPPRDEDDTPFMYLNVKVKFNQRGPKIYLKSGNADPVRLDEEDVKCLDNMDILDIHLDIRPYDNTVNGKDYRTAYLQSMLVTQDVDRFAAMYGI